MSQLCLLTLLALLRGLLFASRHRSSLYWKRYIAHLMRLRNVDVFSSLRQSVIVTLPSQDSVFTRQSLLGDVFHRDYGGNDSQDFEKTVLDEVTESIRLPQFDARASRFAQDPEELELNPKVAAQLRDFVSTVAHMYRDNPFHNFEHASHVTMSVTKLLWRIVAPNDLNYPEERQPLDKQKRKHLASTLHDHTYGITSDPLTQFAVVFSGLIHDVDHVGVPNAQLVKEQTRIAALYRNKSVAEQNSVDLAWDLLLDDHYSDLRSAIYQSREEKKRFRQLVVNTVLATDIVDKELKSLRNSRWERAFHEAAASEDPRDTVNRKATIVIEHLIQASDVAHTMQHWQIYRKWNERFFEESWQAFKAGRAEKNPADSWYQGELGFFDYYIIPLAKKLKNCGVFGVSSEEYLNYAIENRKTWEARGKEVVADMVEMMKLREQTSSSSLESIPVPSRHGSMDTGSGCSIPMYGRHSSMSSINSGGRFGSIGSGESGPAYSQRRTRKSKKTPTYAAKDQLSPSQQHRLSHSNSSLERQFL